MDNVQKKINKIAVFGPHDRMNYGDFLFPIMLDYALSKILKKDVCLKKYSLVNADFSSLGAFKSNNFRKLTLDIEKNEIDTVIVAGGECLSARWNNLYSYINPLYDKFFKINYLKNNRVFRNIPKFLLGGKTEFPFVINNNNYSNNIKIFYNSVGGGVGLNNNTLKILDNCDIIGVRDRLSFDYIKTDFDSSNKYLVPDSAIIISDVFNKKEFKRLIKEDYIFFQLSNFKHQNKIKEIIDQLNEILKTGITVVLCPIGTAKGHEDHIILKYIYDKLNNKNVIFINKQPIINEIINLIIFSKIYIGTSLHGVITSMSYGIPYIALNPKQIKLTSFINTWSINELNFVSELDGFIYYYNKIIKQDLNEKILHKTNELKVEYYNFIELMISKIDDDDYL